LQRLQLDLLKKANVAVNTSAIRCPKNLLWSAKSYCCKTTPIYIIRIKASKPQTAFYVDSGILEPSFLFEF